MNPEFYDNPALLAQYEEAKAAMQVENWHEAADLLAELYEEIGTWDLNYRLVTALFMDEQYQLAENYSDDFLEDYFQSDDTFRLILQLAVYNQQFIYARQLIYSVADKTQQAKWLAEVSLAEEQAEETMVTTLKTVARQFYHMSDYGFEEQRQRYEAGRRLPLDLFVNGAKFLLVDPFTLPVIRASLLEDLQKLKIDEQVDYRWIDEEIYAVNPTQLPALVDNPIFLAIGDKIQQALAQTDPIALEMLLQDARLQLALAHPQIERVVQNVDAWVDAALDLYYGRQTTHEPAEQAAYHLQTLQLTQDLFRDED